jgi:hypothetical protein
MQPSNNQNRAYSAAHFGMTLDQIDEVGLFRSLEGGGVKVDMLSYQVGGDYRVMKQPGKPKFEDFKLQCGMAMGRAFYNWMTDFFVGRGTARSGSLIAADFHYQVRARRNFSGALITEVAMPKLDANDKGPANLTVTIAPELMEFVKPDPGEKLRLPQRTLEQKLWTASNFELQLNGRFETVCANVSKIDGFSVKQKVIDYHAGGQRHPVKSPGRVEWPAINFYVPEAFAGELVDFAYARGVKGWKATEDETGAGAHLMGSIIMYANDRTPVFEVEFSGGEISNVAVDKSDAGSEEIKQVKFEMQLQSLAFKHIEIEKERDELNKMLM